MNMPYTKTLIGLIVSPLMIALASSPTQAVTAQEAFAQGCGGCHTSERKILHRIPSGSDPVRRSWTEKFMANHPNERDALTSEIVEYLIKSAGLSDRLDSHWPVQRARSAPVTLQVHR